MLTNNEYFNTLIWMNFHGTKAIKCRYSIYIHDYKIIFNFNNVFFLIIEPQNSVIRDRYAPRGDVSPIDPHS